MGFESERISQNQLLFSVGAFIQGSTLLTAFVSPVTAHDTWFVTLTGYAFALGLVWIYTRLYNRFPGKNLIQITQAVLGRRLGSAVSLLYLFFFLSLAALNARDVGNFVSTYIMPETPYAAIIILFMATAAYAARKGIRSIARYGTVFVVATFAILIINSLFLIREMDYHNLMPVLKRPLLDYLQGTHIVGIIPFGEMFAFMMIVPSDAPKGAITKPFIGGLSIGAASLMLVVLREATVLGSAVAFFSLPSYEVIRLVNIAHIITRIEDFFAVMLIILRFFKVSVLYYVVVLGIAQLFSLRSIKPIVNVAGGVIICFSLIVFDSTMENGFWGQNFAPFYSMIFELILPLITLIVAAISAAVGKKGVPA